MDKLPEHLHRAFELVVSGRKPLDTEVLNLGGIELIHDRGLATYTGLTELGQQYRRQHCPTKDEQIEDLRAEFDALVQASDALLDEKEDEIYRMRNLLLWAQRVINDRGILEDDDQRLVDEIKDVLTATDDAPPPSEDGHVGFWLDVPGAAPIHVLGDPNMSNETADALRKLAEAAQKYVEDKPTNAPPDLPIALSDAEIELAEEEDQWFQAHYDDETDTDE